jgi:hypothetical protein
MCCEHLQGTQHDRHALLQKLLKLLVSCARHLQVLDYRTGAVRTLWVHPSFVLRWMLAHLPVGLAVLGFMALASLILTFFLA